MPAAPVTIEPARTEADFAVAKELIRAYVDWLGEDLSYQNFDDEMAGFPAKYLPPKGEILLARLEGAAVGVVCLQPLAEGICEMKRMWADPACRGRGIGRRLAEAIVRTGRERGYRLMRLDTLSRLTSAVSLYENMGFRRIPAYYNNPTEGVIYLELDLSGGETT